jgi:hypothetical protein
MVNPKLIDSLIRLTTMKRNISTFSLDMDDSLAKSKDSIIHDMEIFKEKTHHTNILDGITQLTSAVNFYNTGLDSLSKYLEDSIHKLEVKVIQDNYRNYESFDTTVDEKITIRSTFSKNLSEYLYGLKNSTNNWQFAGVDLWPTDPKFTRELVGSNPLYIVADQELAEIVSNEFNDFFSQRRLRKYESLSSLPDNGIGVAYCFGKYENMPIDPIKDEIAILFNKLQPGGVFYFTYNNCEYIRSLEFCNNYRAYQTEKLISILFYSIGFDKIENKVFDDGAHNVMIVKKPGELASKKLNSPEINIVRKSLTPEQIDWIEAHRQHRLTQWIVAVQNDPSYPGNFKVEKQLIIEYIQRNIDSRSE